MYRRSPVKKLSSFQIIILGFLGLILVGTLLLMLPVSSSRRWCCSYSDSRDLRLQTHIGIGYRMIKVE